MYRYDIVEKDKKDFILASCLSLELAKKYLKEMKETDKSLQKYYNWEKLPEYEIIKNNY